ncbi:unnamed protein product [Paramecium pentaurelia]|uniref:Uncharacterized protein n=1 Tax=Paramecium pentaurelia TaxID=43138 RepID=A0A8S1YHP4_9CILI|nr:unnamed protein product [Paramecium pentaurelia]
MDYNMEGQNFRSCQQIVLQRWNIVRAVERTNQQLLEVNLLKQNRNLRMWRIKSLKIESLKIYQLVLFDVRGGLYKQDQKDGKWIDLNDSVWNQNQIVYNGEYKNGNKIGLWNILYKSKDSNYKIIGGGQYDENGQKNGRWIDLNNVFWNKSEVIYHGQYKNGLKIGKWDTNDLQNTQNNQISYSIIF